MAAFIFDQPPPISTIQKTVIYIWYDHAKDNISKSHSHSLVHVSAKQCKCVHLMIRVYSSKF